MTKSERVAEAMWDALRQSDEAPRHATDISWPELVGAAPHVDGVSELVSYLRLRASESARSLVDVWERIA